MAKFQNITLNAGMVPTEIVAPLTGPVTVDQFNLRLASGGTMELIDSIWEIGPADFLNHSIVFAALDKLILNGKSEIITNGNTLVLFVNQIMSQDAQIVSFGTNTKAPSGADGNGTGNPGAPGQPGIGGGLVTFNIIQQLTGILHFNLFGQNGGDGGTGVAGTQGPGGSAGTPCQAGVCLPGGWFPTPYPCCKHDGGQGGKGGTGSPGGHGGDGGTAGQGGMVILVNVGPNPLPTASYTFSAPAGVPGAGGHGGAGGAGGPGGPGGDGNTLCHGGPSGPPGDAGRQGDPGNTGSGNASGKILQQNTDIQAVVRTLNNSPRPGILSVRMNHLSVAGESIMRPDSDCDCK